MTIFITGAWLLWTCLIVQNAKQQAAKDEVKQEFKHFKETPHRYKISNIGE